jgi:hypothetical protein
MSELPTVRIQHLDGYAIINRSDFDPAIHQLYEELALEPKPIETQPRKGKRINVGSGNTQQSSSLPTGID